MARTHPAKYSWYNKTTQKPHYWEDKEVLNLQRRNGDDCVNVESDIIISKKQMNKGVPQALINRVHKSITFQISMLPVNDDESGSLNGHINQKELAEKLLKFVTIS